jgi:MoxR-like ATPase
MRGGKFAFFGVADVNQELINYGETIASLREGDQLAVARSWLNAIIDDRKLLNDLLDLFARAANHERYFAIREHIRQILEHDTSMPPHEAAYEVRRRLKISAKMRPLTIALARREKNRMRAESRRASGGRKS